MDRSQLGIVEDRQGLAGLKDMSSYINHDYMMILYDYYMILWYIITYLKMLQCYNLRMMLMILMILNIL